MTMILDERDEMRRVSAAKTFAGMSKAEEHRDRLREHLKETKEHAKEAKKQLDEDEKEAHRAWRQACGAMLSYAYAEQDLTSLFLRDERNRRLIEDLDRTRFELAMIEDQVKVQAKGLSEAKDYIAQKKKAKFSKEELEDDQKALISVEAKLADLKTTRAVLREEKTRLEGTHTRRWDKFIRP